MSGTLWIVGGSNGAGKTTAVSSAAVRDELEGVEFLNPADVTLTKLRSLGYSNFADVPEDELRGLFLESAIETEETMANLLAIGRSVGIETVLSSAKYKRHVEELIENGGEFRLIYVSLRSADLGVERVSSRQLLGGHGVPEDKIRSRFIRSHENLPWFLSRASMGFIFDNSSADEEAAPKLVAIATDGVLNVIDDIDIAPQLRRALGV